MKHTFKKALALLLTLALAVPMFGVFASAEMLSVTEDFSGMSTMDESFNLTTANGWTGHVESPYYAPSSLTTTNNLTYTFSNTNRSVYRLMAPDSFAGKEYWTMTGIFKLETAASQIDGNYYRFFVMSDTTIDTTTEDTICLDFRKNTDDAAATYTYWKDGASAITATNLKFTEKIGIKAVRAGDSFTVTFYPVSEGIDGANALELTTTVTDNFNAIPGFRFQCGGTSNGAVTISLDDLIITEDDGQPSVDVNETPDNVLPYNWYTYINDFEDEESPYGMWKWEADLSADSIEERVSNSGDMAMKIAKTSTAVERIRLVPDKTKYSVGTSYTLGFDLFISDDFKINSNYDRLHLRAWENDMTVYGMVHFTNAGAGMYVNINGGTQSATVPVEYYDNQELRVEYTRNGAMATINLWVKGRKAETLLTSTATTTSEGYDTKVGAPELRFELCSANTGALWIDNLTIANVDGSTSMVGAQASDWEGTTDTDLNDGVCSVRFIATIDSLDYSKAGFKVNAAWGDGQTQSWYIDNCVAYNAITANEDGTVQKYTAQELGGKYLIAVTLTNIPKNIADGMTLSAEAFVISQDGYATVYSGEGAVDITVTDGVVGLAAAAN